MILKNIITISFRYFSNTSVNYSTFHQSKFLAKLVYGTRRKKIWYEGNDKIKETLPIMSSLKKGAGSKRRQEVLNKLFERHITEMISSGGILSEAISGCGVHISKIKITQDHNILNIHWISNENDSAKVEQTFNDNKNYLRHELSRLNLIGHVPKIEFVRDKDLLKFVEVEKMLTGLKGVIEKDKVVESTLESIQENEIESNLAVEVEDVEVEEEEEPLPPMPANVYKLDHETIIAKIQTSLKRSKAPHRFGLNSELEINNEDNKNTSESILPPQTINFKSYLKKKAIMKEKARKIREEIYLEKNIEDSQFEEELRDGFNDTFK